MKEKKIMPSIRLPLNPLVLSIGVGEEPGPVPGNGAAPLFFRFEQLSATLLHQLEPIEVLSWLFSPTHDCCDIGEVLVKAGFRGRYRAVAQALPNPAAVTREIRQRFPDLKFELVCPAELVGQAKDYHSRMAAPVQALEMA